jgi:Predicted signal transduction protein with a C-terminal ATPase domain
MRNPFVRPITFIRGLKLKKKLMFSYLIFFFFPLLFFTIYAFMSFSGILRSDVISSLDANYKQTFNYLSDKTDKVLNTSDIVLSNDSINNVFSLKKNGYWQADNYNLVRQSMDFLSSLEEDDITRVVLYLYQDESNPSLSYNYKSIANVQKAKWYRLMEKHGWGELWCPGSYLHSGNTYLDTLNNGNFALIRKYNDPANYSKRLGYFCIYFSENEIKKIVDEANTINGSTTMLVNSRGDLVYSSDQTQYAALFRYFDRRTGIKSVSALLKSCELKGKNLIYAEKQLPGTDWSLFTIVPYDDVFSQVNKTQRNILIFTVLVSLLCMFFAWKVSNSITRRITTLQRKMKLAEQGDMTPLKGMSYGDDIGSLYKSYNYMITEIERLMAERYEAGIQAKTAEMHALQSQIKPHFLYNTLDTINFLAQKNNVEEVEKAITSLATFYKLSLSKGNDEIPLADELRQISSYVQIQNIRFSNSITLIYDMEEELGRYLILKLILQPFVENSILHGIMSKPTKEGSIIIKAVIENGAVKISIQDNGIGMTEETLDRIRRDMSGKAGGYGIKNVVQRIRFYYGGQYGVTFGSTYGAGTIVEISIPAIPPNEEAD